MKLNTKFILITFVAVLLISIPSMLIFYALSGKVIKQQQVKEVINATTNFAFAFQTELQKIDEDFKSILPFIEDINSIKLENTSIDFVFTLENDSLINKKEFKVNSESYLNYRNSSIQKFFNDNPTLVLRFTQLENGKTVYYGRSITSEFLNGIGDKINANIAFVVNDSPIEVSNPSQNQTRLLSIVNASRDLKFKNNFDVYSEELSDSDFISSIYTSKFTLFPSSRASFVVFLNLKEGLEFRETLRMVMLLIILAGSALIFIIVLLSTSKLRKQVSLLNEAVLESRKGNLDKRVPIITKDEIGHFGESFNIMLEEIVLKNKKEKEYTEFITLINQKPTLKEVSDAALLKIIKSIHVSFGALYIVENKKVRMLSSFGLNDSELKISYDDNFYLNAIEKKEVLEFNFTENYPEVKTGMASVKIKYLLIFPIIYNKETVALLEIASESEPKDEMQSYINSVHDQLAVGLVNASSFEQLENLVNELRTLNEESKRQNTQIISQNEELRKLHDQLKEKAVELDGQRKQAVELTKVKSDFLASMSHELRTPLISILGLTDLLIKDINIDHKIKDRVKIVYRNGKKLLSLINNILEFSKFESGKIEIKKETFLIADMIEEIHPAIQQLTHDKNLQLLIELPANKNILINSDKTKIEQILSNLIINAIKFTEKGFVKLSIVIKNGTDLIFSVIDSGIGISESDKENIFKEFKQVDSSYSRKYGGAGLGLAICKKYIELLGGKLDLESEPGQGSKFSFEITDVILDIIEIEEHSFLSVEKHKAHSQENILLVSDNEAANKLIIDYLHSYKVNVETKYSIVEAENAILEKSFSAIILNKLDGIWSFIYSIKQNDHNKETPIIFTLILEEQRIGWEPEIFDFIMHHDINKNIIMVLNNAETFYKKPIEKVVVISSGPSKIKDELVSVENVIYLDLLDQIKSKEVTPDILFLDLETLGAEALSICNEMSSEKNLKNLPIVFVMPQNASNDFSNTMSSKLTEIALSVKHHPMDILKVLRDRLCLESKTENEKTKLLEIPNEEKPNYGKSQIKLKPTVLIVDDDNDALFTVGEYIKQMNFDTIFAHNGMECLLMLNHVSPELILLDIMMPQMDGFETIKRIRNDNRFENLPVIALTAYAMLENKDVIEKNGFDDVVTKPINPQTLQAKISKYLTQN